MVEDDRHGWSTGDRSHDVEPEACFVDCLHHSGTKGGNAHILLAELGKVFEERLYIERAEEDDDIVEPDVDFGKVGTLGFVDDCLFEIELMLRQQFEHALLWRVGTGDEIFFFPMFANDFEKVFNRLVAEENFALSELNIFLKVVGNGIGEAEIFYGLRRGNAQSSAYAEKLVNGIAADENDCGIIEYVYFLLAEAACRNGLHLDERTKVNLQAVLFSQIEVR